MKGNMARQSGFTLLELVIVVLVVVLLVLLLVFMSQK